MDASQYADLFLTESREHVSAMNQWLLQLERDGAAGSAEPVREEINAAATARSAAGSFTFSPPATLR